MLHFALSLSAAPPPEAVSLFDQANRLYETGKYGEAIAAYEKLVTTGVISAPVYFNLGNACFKSGQIGRAIINYRLAERLAPRDPDIRANLQFARNQAGGQGTPGGPRWWRRAAGKLTLNEWTLLAGSACWIWFGLLALGQLRPLWRPTLRLYSPIAGLATGLFGLGLGLAFREQFGELSGVVIARDAIVRFGPLDKSPTHYTLHNGAEVRVLDQYNGWVEITDSTNRKGWLPGESVLLVTSAPAGAPAPAPRK